MPHLVADLVSWVDDAFERKVHGVEIAAYILWRVNWIHPFAGGNGRTARAAAYLALCMRAEMMIPGERPLPAWICGERDAYIEALRSVDASLAGEDGRPDQSREPNLTEMNRFIERLVCEQVRPWLDWRPYAGAFAEFLLNREAVIDRLKDFAAAVGAAAAAGSEGPKK